MSGLADYIREQLHSAKLEKLRAMPVKELRRLWDAVGDDSFAEGFDVADIHLVLNEKGDGAYCAV